MTVAEVRAVVGEHRLRHVFDLTARVAPGTPAPRWRCCESLLNAGEEPLAVLAMLTREVRAAWQVADGLRRSRARRRSRAACGARPPRPPP